MGKTYFLANLATFGITGGKLSRYGANGAVLWMKVVGTVLKGVGEGWGRWVEGIEEAPLEDRSTPQPHSEDEDHDGDVSMPLTQSSSMVVQSSSRSRRTGSRRPPIAQNVASKVTLLTSPAHMATMALMITSPNSKSPTSLVIDFALFALGLLNAFRGTSRWEVILDGLLEGDKGWPLTKRLWREGVRSRWQGSEEREVWEHFAESEFDFSFPVLHKVCLYPSLRRQTLAHHVCCSLPISTATISSSRPTTNSLRKEARQTPSISTKC